MKLRPYQERAVNDVLEYAVDNVNGRVLLVVPGGGGKTLIGATLLKVLAVENCFHGLAWAHRMELVDGMYEHLIECGVPREIIGVELAAARARPGGRPEPLRASPGARRHRPARRPRRCVMMTGGDQQAAADPGAWLRARRASSSF